PTRRPPPRRCRDPGAARRWSRTGGSRRSSRRRRRCPRRRRLTRSRRDRRRRRRRIRRGARTWGGGAARRGAALQGQGHHWPCDIAARIARRDAPLSAALPNATRRASGPPRPPGSLDRADAVAGGGLGVLDPVEHLVAAQPRELVDAAVGLVGVVGLVRLAGVVLGQLGAAELRLVVGDAGRLGGEAGGRSLILGEALEELLAGHLGQAVAGLLRGGTAAAAAGAEKSDESRCQNRTLH